MRAGGPSYSRQRGVIFGGAFNSALDTFSGWEGDPIGKIYDTWNGLTSYINASPAEKGRIDANGLNQTMVGFGVMAPFGEIGGFKMPLAAEEKTLFHYTNEAGYNAIMESGELKPSIGVKNARYGPGQYFTDIAPGDFTKGQTSRRLFGVPWNGTRLTHFFEVNVNGLGYKKNAPFNYLVPGTKGLPIRGRVVKSGLSGF